MIYIKYRLSLDGNTKVEKTDGVILISDQGNILFPLMTGHTLSLRPSQIIAISPNKKYLESIDRNTK